MNNNPPEPEFSCVHSERCGGCAFMGVPIQAQLANKQAEVRAALAGYAALGALEVQATLAAAPALGYRTRAKLIVSPAGEIGLFERGSHVVVDIPGCRVLHPALLAVVAALRERVPAVSGALTGLDVRLVHGAEGAGEQLGVLVTLAGLAHSRASLETLAHELSRHPLVRGVAVRVQSPNAVQLLDGTAEPIAGTSVLRDSLRAGGPFHYVTFGSFVQAHRGQAAALAGFVIQQIEQVIGSLAGQRVLELFAGSGALGLELCVLGARVTLVERYAPALEHARRAQREQGLADIAAISGEAEQVVRDLVARSSHFAAVIVNPPRRGLRPGLRALLADLAPRAIAYVSCDPHSLARDLADFAQRGWSGRGVQPFDMIPLSSGVESALVLTPATPRRIPVLYEDDQLLIVDKPPHLPTIPDAAHKSSLLRRLQHEHALPELTALHRLDVGTSGVCLFAKRRSEVHALAARLQAGEKHYLALVRGGIRAKGIVRAGLREQGKTRAATSRYTRVSRAGSHSLVRVRPEQGRTHQVRKHMAAIGHPVLGDERYGDEPSNRYFEHRYGLDRTFLHAARVVLAPDGAQPALEIQAALAPDLAAVVASLREEAV
jgi:23S rRNA (uracil1939-C5)-methyltransferase